MKWERINSYYLQSGEWTICKYFSPGKPYALWHKGNLIGFYDTSEQAKESANDSANNTNPMDTRAGRATPRTLPTQADA